MIKARRETIGLVAAASAMTFALAYAVHSKQAQVPSAPTARLQQQDWMGHLAEVAPRTETAPPEPMSSAALVVPKSQLALPSTPTRPPAKPRPCEDRPCAAKANAQATAARRQIAAAESASTGKSERDRESGKSLLGTLNPLNHLPDMSMIGRPFAYAGNTVSGWFRR